MQCKRCSWPVSFWHRDIYTGLCPICRNINLAFPGLDEKSAFQKAIYVHASEDLARGEPDTVVRGKLIESGFSPEAASTIVREIVAGKEAQNSDYSGIDGEGWMNRQSLPCPTCNRLTTSLKRYHFVKWCLFLGVAVFFRRETHTACPGCMRRYLWTRSLLTAIPANIIWVLGLLPLTIILTIATFTKGHSKNLVEVYLPEAHERAF